jgi:hypothetical protein
MDRALVLGLANAVGLAILGGAILVQGDERIPVEVVDASAELTGAAAGPLTARVAESGAQGELLCKRGVISNLPPDTLYCTDGKTAGFVVPDKVAEDLVSELDDKLGVTSDELRVEVHEGKVYAGARGLRETRADEVARGRNR